MQLVEECPAGPITPEQPQERLQHHDMPVPKALAAQFDGLSVGSGAASPGSPRSPFAAGGSRQQQRGAASTTTSDSDDCGGSGDGSSGDLAAAAAAAGPHLDPPRWRQAVHDLEEPILSASSERFCLLPVK